MEKISTVEVKDVSVFDMAVELGKKMSTTEEYQRVLDTQQAVAKDKEARALVKEFQQLQQSYQRMQMMGHKLTEENLKTLEEAEKKASANDLVKEYLTAQAKFYEVVSEVNVKIQEGLKGVPAAAEEPQSQGGCSPSDNACGGCSGC